MKKVLQKIAQKFRIAAENNASVAEPYDFNKSNPLGGGGERVDIQLNKKIDFEKLDIYQKSHYSRYEFAKQKIDNNEVCGDFACGTGYGSIMLSQKAKNVIGADLDKTVIEEIKKRYSNNSKVTFLNENLLNLNYNQYFDTIVSFETIEHFKEEDIYTLFSIFNKALQPGGKLIFSTPYHQEKTEDAVKMGFHLTFYITESVIKKWLAVTGFNLLEFNYQNYQDHQIVSELNSKDFIITVCQKKMEA